MEDVDAAGRALLGLVNNGEQIQRLPANATKFDFIDTINRLVYAHNSKTVSQIYSDTEVRRMIVGYQKDGWGVGKHFGIKLSKPNVDVLTAVDDDLLFKLVY